MKKILLICVKGMYASMVADEIQLAANKIGYECEVSAISTTDLHRMPTGTWI